MQSNLSAVHTPRQSGLGFKTKADPQTFSAATLHPSNVLESKPSKPGCGSLLGPWELCDRNGVVSSLMNSLYPNVMPQGSPGNMQPLQGWFLPQYLFSGLLGISSCYSQGIPTRVWHPPLLAAFLALCFDSHNGFCCCCF